MRNDRDDMGDVRAFLARMAAEARVPAEQNEPVVRRARRHAVATLVGGALAITLLAAGSAAALGAVREWNRGTPLVSVPPPTPTASPNVPITGRFGENDLRELVLRWSERPGGYGLRHDATYSEFEDVTQVATTLGIPVDGLAQTGFVTSFINGFLSDSFNNPVAPAKARVDLISYAMLFPDADAAHAGFDLIGRGPTERSHWRRGPEAGLGEEAIASRGTFEGLATVVYVWRVDNVVLFIASQGAREALPADVVRSLAGMMDAWAS